MSWGNWGWLSNPSNASPRVYVVWESLAPATGSGGCWSLPSFIKAMYWSFLSPLGLQRFILGHLYLVLRSTGSGCHVCTALGFLGYIPLPHTRCACIDSNRYWVLWRCMHHNYSLWLLNTYSCKSVSEVTFYVFILACTIYINLYPGAYNPSW